jgi:inhibitor of KinA sporulation pathway (predicted exonuclease)
MIILDLEWNSGYDKTPLEEILQIGAVRLDAFGGRITDTFCAFVHPRVHKKYNRTAKALPELRASDASQLDFPQALARFTAWCGADTVFADWGGDDFAVLRHNCAFWKLPLPSVTRHIDLQAAFSLKVGTNQSVALSRAVEYCGIPDTFTFHNALNDAIYTALVSAWIDQDTLALLAMPKELRRLAQAPVFPLPPARRTGPYPSHAAAFNSRGCRRQSCPVCGEDIWLRHWYPAGQDRYLSPLRCPAHGEFLCALTLTPTADGKWLAQTELPALTPALLREYAAAHRRNAIVCKGAQRRKRHWQRRRGQT